MSFSIATYAQVERDFRSYKKQREGPEVDQSNAPDMNEFPLFELSFYRIILDEGDSIKNYHGSSM